MENMPQYGIRCMTGQDNKWHEIIYRQTYDIREDP